MSGPRLSAEDLNAIISNPDDFRSIRCETAGSEWHDLVDGIMLSIANRAKSVQPMAYLNEDGSISFYLHKCETPDCEACKSNSGFEEKLLAPYVRAQLEYYRVKNNIPLLGSSGEIIEHNRNEALDLVEFKINLSPINFDTLLKLNSQYIGYRAENSVLKLQKQPTIKAGVIRLWPVSPIDNKTNIMLAAGCQVTELPTVQCAPLLPDFNPNEAYFHWVPHNVTQKLSLGSPDVLSILASLLNAHAQNKSDLHLNSSNEAVLISTPDSADGPVRIVEMDEDSRNFYLLYGNVGHDDLMQMQAKSLEVDSTAFFEAVKQNLLTQQTLYENADGSEKRPEVLDYYSRELDKLKQSIWLVEILINDEALGKAISNNDIEAVIALLARPDININGFTTFGRLLPLAWELAKKIADFRIFELLLNNERSVLSPDDKQQLIMDLHALYESSPEMPPEKIAFLLRFLSNPKLFLNKEELKTLGIKDDKIPTLYPELFKNFMPYVLSWMQSQSPELQNSLKEKLENNSTILGQIFCYDQATRLARPLNTASVSSIVKNESYPHIPTP
jgi:hypothetical protein